MKRIDLRRFAGVLLTVSALAIAACSGGGSGGGSTISPGSGSTAAPQSAQLLVTINNGPTGSSSSREPRALSNGAHYFVIYADRDSGSAQVFASSGATTGEGTATLSGSGATLSVSFTASVPIGIHDFTVLTYDTNPGCPQAVCATGGGIQAANVTTGSPNGAHLLNSGTKTAVNVTPTGTTTIALTLNAIIASFKFNGSAAAQVAVTEGTDTAAASIALEADDASGAAILGSSGSFTNPINIAIRDNGINQGSATDGTFENVDVTAGGGGFTGTTAALAYGLYNSAGFVSGNAFSSLVTNLAIKYYYRSQPSGDANAAGKGIVSATITASASGATSGSVTIASVPAALGSTTAVVPQLDNQPGTAAGNGTPCIYNSSQYTFQAQFGYNNTAVYRYQSAPFTADNTGGGLDTFTYTSGGSNLQFFSESASYTLTTNPPSAAAGNYIYLPGQHFNTILAQWQSTANNFATAAAFTYTLGGTTLGNASSQTFAECGSTIRQTPPPGTPVVTVGITSPGTLTANTMSLTILPIVYVDGGSNPIAGNFTSPVTLTVDDLPGATALNVNGGAFSQSVQVTKGSDVVQFQYSGLALNTPVHITPTGATVTGNTLAIPTAVNDVTLTGTTLDTAANGGLNTDPNWGQQTVFFASPSNSAQNITGAELGYTNAPYSQQFTGTLSAGCAGIASISAGPATTFTITPLGSAGICSGQLSETGSGYPLTNHTANASGSATHDGKFWISVTSGSLTIDANKRSPR